MAKKVNIVTLGCSKNLVDTEKLAAALSKNGFEISFDSGDTSEDYTIINTCGFIHDAKEESIETILDFVNAKNNGQIQKIAVMGCLSQRYLNDLEKEIPEVDRFFGVDEEQKIVEFLSQTTQIYPLIRSERLQTTPKHYAYLKISEGCDRTCSFCAIPLIRGKHKSVPIDSLVEETKQLAANGVKEIILIAQDLTYYGLDIYKKQRLADLIEQLSEISGIEWIRLHYAFPAKFPSNVLEVMKKNPKVCKYIDIPLQHISDNVLKKMRRGHTKKQTLSLLKSFRELIPEMAIRTTLLVGHPDETELDFEELREFVASQKFDRLGVFAYSHEENTYAGDTFTDNVPEEIKQQRVDEIMQLQHNISLENNQKRLGTTEKIIIDSKEADFWLARTQFDSPEVDNEVLISATDFPNLTVGEFYMAKIFRSDVYDVYAQILE